MISSLAAYLSRAKCLKEVEIRFKEEEDDISAVVGVLCCSKCIEHLEITFTLVQENDQTLLLDLISKSRSINYLGICTGRLENSLIYRSVEALEASHSVVNFALDFQLVDGSPDYKEIAASVAKCQVLNAFHLFGDSLLEVEEADMASDMFLSECTNLNEVEINDTDKRREDSDESTL